MTQLFKVATCSQCGAGLDLLTLKCQHCGIQSLPVNIFTASPLAFSRGNGSDFPSNCIATLDNIFLTHLQIQALAQGIEVVLTQIEDGRVKINIVLQRSKKLAEIGYISIYSRPTTWHVYYHGDAGLFKGYGKITWAVDTAINWERVISDTTNGDALFICLDNLYRNEEQRKNRYDRYEREKTVFRGAEDLFLHCRALKEIARLMIDFAFYEARDEERIIHRQTRIAQVPRPLQGLASFFLT